MGKEQRQKAGAEEGIVVFWILKESVCSECGTELWKGSFLKMEGGKPL